MGVLELTMLQVVVALAAVVAGACLQGSLGFGLGLVAAPVLVLLDTRLVPGPVLCLSVPLAFLVAWRERASLDFSEIRWAIVGRIPGSILGSIAVVALTRGWIARLFAVALLIAVASAVSGWSVERNRRTLLGAGLISGAMGTATSVGGPPVALVYQRSSGPVLRASIAAFMVFGAAFSLLVLAVVGGFTTTDLQLAVLLLPGVLIGFVISRWTNPILDNGYTRPAVLLFAAVSAISILVRETL